MLIHNFLVSIRTFKRYKSSFGINLLGLIGGLVAVLFIYLWVNHELSVDTFHEDNDRIFRMVSDNASNSTLLNTSSRFAVELAESIPEIELLVNSSWSQLESALTLDETLYSSIGDFGSSDFFKVFSYNLIYGDPNTVLDLPNSVVLSESMAKKLFNSVDVIGRSLEWRWYTAAESVVITGVFEDPPVNSSIQLDFVLTFKIFERRFAERIARGSRSSRSFFKLKPGADVNLVNQKIAQHTREHYPDYGGRPYFLIGYSDHYQNGWYENGKAVGGLIIQIRLFIVIGILILVIACVNFMNLSTARATLRTKEIGVRKVMGASKKSLINQFLIEACILNVLSGIIAIGFVVLLFPYFEQVVGHKIMYRFDLTSVAAFSSIILLSGLLSGIYPAFYLSGFNPIRAIKSIPSATSNAQWMRKGLVIFQFSISLVLITSVLVMHNQMEYMRHKNLGYDNACILNLRTGGMNREKQQTFLTEARKINGITNASGITHALFGAQRSSANVTWFGKDSDQVVWFEYGSVDYDMLELLELEAIHGRFFSRSFGNERSKVVINEVTRNLIQMDNPIGQTLTVNDNNYEIIGVVSDFHFQSLHEEIKPTFFLLNSGYSMKLALRIEPAKLLETVTKIESLYSKVNAGYPFEYSFHDQDQQSFYETEQRVAKLSRYAAGLATCITCLGLFGLISFVTEQKAKELSIRKVLGASSKALVFTISKEVNLALLVASIFGVMCSVVALEVWLNKFAYRISLEWWHFAISIFIMIFLAISTMLTQLKKTINANPIDALKEE